MVGVTLLPGIVSFCDLPNDLIFGRDRGLSELLVNCLAFVDECQGLTFAGTPVKTSRDAFRNILYSSADVVG